MAITSMEIAELRKQSLLAAELSAEFAKRMRAAGTLTELEFSTLTAAAEEAKLELATAEAEAAAARERLAGLLCLDPAQKFMLAAQLDEVAAEPEAADKLEAQAVEKSYALESLRRKFEASTAKRQLAHPLGFLDVGAVAEKDYGDGWAVGPSLSIEIPIFDQGQAKIASAAAEVRQSKQEILSTQRQIASQVREARIRLIAARNRAMQYKTVVLPLREKITAETQVENGAMLVSLFHLLSVKQQEIEARIAYRIALRDYRLADATLNQLVTGGHIQNISTGEKE
jgi:cobalt-zinc-cadmium efflux system outer membrane protein